MGISTFVVVIKDVGQLRAARRAIEAHNKVPPDARVKLPHGETFATIDPKRSGVAEAFRQHLQGSRALNGFEESFHGGQLPEDGVTFARGEDIRSEGCFVLYKGDVWLEAANGGGGASTTLYFEREFSSIRWMGTRGKPPEFANAPIVARFATLDEMSTAFAAAKEAQEAERAGKRKRHD